MPDQPEVSSGESARAAVQPPAGMLGTPGPLLSIVKDQRIAFVIVGGANTAIGYGFFVFYLLFVPYLVALAFAYVCAVLCAFVLYRTLVFRVRGNVLRDLGRFSLVYVTSLCINYALLPFAVEVLHIGPKVAQLGITLITTIISYVGHREFSFRRKPTPTGVTGSGSETPASLA